VARKAIRKLRVGYLDIEKTNLNADFGIMLCWVMKGDSTPKKHDVLTRSSVESGLYDYHVVFQLAQEMKNYDVI